MEPFSKFLLELSRHSKGDTLFFQIDLGILVALGLFMAADPKRLAVSCVAPVFQPGGMAFIAVLFKITSSIYRSVFVNTLDDDPAVIVERQV